MMKTPITYYGGKQTMLHHILPMIPEHQLYCEPFVGGAAVFWAKPKSAIEVINDKNGELMNFYEQIQKNADELNKEIQATLHSRRAYQFATIVYQNPEFFTPIKRAWAIWTLCNQGFAGQMARSWGYSRKPTIRESDACTLKTINKKLYFELKDDFGLFRLAKRIETVQLENNDAIKVIQSRDEKWSFHYIDPPYVESNQGHYAGYTHDDFEALLNALVDLKGKFLLSCYDVQLLRKYAEKAGWKVFKIEKPLCAAKVKDGEKRSNKVECLIRNY